MSLYSNMSLPEDVVMELGKMATIRGFAGFLQESSDAGFVLEYPEDRDMGEEEFQAIVRFRWNTIKTAWRLRSARETSVVFRRNNDD